MSNVTILREPDQGNRRNGRNPSSSRPVTNARVCWNCSGYVRLRETRCPRCGAERLAAEPEVIWQQPPDRPHWQVMKYASYVAGLLGGLAWLAIHRTSLFG